MRTLDGVRLFVIFAAGAVDDADSSIAQAFGLSAFPYWVFVDADGTVAGRAAGELSIADLEVIVGRLAE